MTGHPKITSITIRGTEYPSVKAAAEALGVTSNQIYYYMYRGQLDAVGLPKEYIIKIGKTIYKSVEEAAAGSGYTKAAIYTALSRGKMHTIGTGSGGVGVKKRPMADGRPNHRARPFEMGGMSFISITEASDKLKLPYDLVRSVVNGTSPRATERMMGTIMRMKAQTEQTAYRRAQLKLDMERDDAYTIKLREKSNARYYRRKAREQGAQA